MRVSEETLIVPKYGGVLVGPDQLRQVFNDTDAEVLWLIIGAPEEAEFLPNAKTKPDLSLIYPTDPKELPPELSGHDWPADSYVWRMTNQSKLHPLIGVFSGACSGMMTIDQALNLLSHKYESIRRQT